jgi:hypothetical protein
MRAPAHLDRLLEALESELLDARDEEVLQALHDLGMDPKMRGSVAFFGLKSALPSRLEDFFDLEQLDAPTRAKLQPWLKRLEDAKRFKGPRSE